MLIQFNKPFGVICQFSPSGEKPTLKHFISIPNVYPLGRLDTDSEGLLLLSDDGRLQSRIADPRSKTPKTYWVEVEGLPAETDLALLRAGLDLGDFFSRPAAAQAMPAPLPLWEREPPVRVRKNIPTSWLEVVITEGKNRQVRRMTAKIGFPTLRLIRVAIGEWKLGDLAPGSWCEAPTLSRQSQPHVGGKKT